MKKTSAAAASSKPPTAASKLKPQPPPTAAGTAAKKRGVTAKQPKPQQVNDENAKPPVEEQKEEHAPLAALTEDDITKQESSQLTGDTLDGDKQGDTVDGSQAIDEEDDSLTASTLTTRNESQTAIEWLTDLIALSLEVSATDVDAFLLHHKAAVDALLASTVLGSTLVVGLLNNTAQHQHDAAATRFDSPLILLHDSHNDSVKHRSQQYQSAINRSMYVLKASDATISATQTLSSTYLLQHLEYGILPTYHLQSVHNVIRLMFMNDMLWQAGGDSELQKVEAGLEQQLSLHSQKHGVEEHKEAADHTSSSTSLLAASTAKPSYDTTHADAADSNQPAEISPEFHSQILRFCSTIDHAISQVENNVKLVQPQLLQTMTLDGNHLNDYLDNEVLLGQLENCLEEWITVISTVIESENRKKVMSEGSTTVSSSSGNASAHQSTMNNNNTNGNPLAEIQYWRDRHTIFSSLYEQLTTTQMKLMIRIMEVSNITAMDLFKKNLHELLKYYIEAKDNVKFLITLERHFKVLSSSNLVAMYETIPSMMNSLRMVWIISRHYNKDYRMFPLMERIAREIEYQIGQHINVRMLFKPFIALQQQMYPLQQQQQQLTADKDSSKQHATTAAATTTTSTHNGTYLLTQITTTIKQAKSVLQRWYDSYMHMREKIELSGSDRRWEFNRNKLFDTTTYMSQICTNLLEITETLDQFYRFLGPELKAVTGDTEGIQQVLNHVFTLLLPLETLPYNIFDIRYSSSWEQHMLEFNSNVTTIETKTKQFIDHSFTKLRNAESAFDLLNNFKAIESRSSIQQQMKHKFIDILIQYSKEVDVVKQLFLTQYLNPPIHRHQPPVAGRIAWSRSLYYRIKKSILKFQQMPGLLESQEGITVCQEYVNVAKMLVNYENELLSVWRTSVHQIATHRLREYILRYEDEDPTVTSELANTHTSNSSQSNSDHLQQQRAELEKVRTHTNQVITYAVQHKQQLKHLTVAGNNNHQNQPLINSNDKQNRRRGGGGAADDKSGATTQQSYNPNASTMFNPNMSYVGGGRPSHNISTRSSNSSAHSSSLQQPSYSQSFYGNGGQIPPQSATATANSRKGNGKRRNKANASSQPSQHGANQHNNQSAVSAGYRSYQHALHIQSQILRIAARKIVVNFSPDLLQLMKETKYLDRLNIDIPDIARNLVLQEHKYYTLCEHLASMLGNYHSVLQKLSDVEKQLLSTRIAELLLTLQPGFSPLNWNSLTIPMYIELCEKSISQFDTIVHSIQKNRDVIRGIIKAFRGTQLIVHPVFDVLKQKTHELSTSSSAYTSQTIDDFYELLEQHRLKVVDELVVKYRSITRLLMIIELHVCETETGYSAQMSQYYTYWEQQIFSALTQMIAVGMKDFQLLLQSTSSPANIHPTQQYQTLYPPLISVSTDIQAPQIIIYPPIQDIYKSLSKIVRNIPESAKLFHRWMRGQCNVCEPVRLGDNGTNTTSSTGGGGGKAAAATAATDDHTFLYTFYDDLSKNPVIVGLVLEVTQNIQAVIHAVDKYADTWQKYDTRYQLWNMRKLQALERLRTSANTVSVSSSSAGGSGGAAASGLLASTSTTGTSSSSTSDKSRSTSYFERQLQRYKTLAEEVKQMSVEKNIEFIRVNNALVINAVVKQSTIWLSTYGDILREMATQQLHSTMDDIQQCKQRCQREVTTDDVNERNNLLKSIEQVPRRNNDMELVFAEIGEKYRTLAMYNIRVADTDLETVKTMPQQWQQVLELARQRIHSLEAGEESVLSRNASKVSLGVPPAVE